MRAGRPRAAIIGTGFIAAVHRDGLIRNGVEVAGVLGSSAARGAEAATSWGLRRSYADLDELVNDGEVEVVHITSPNANHYRQAAALLGARKHVVCEKPLAVSVEESRDLVRLARAAGVVHAVNYNIRHYPLVREARARIASGSIGAVRLATGDYFQDWMSKADDWNWRVEADRGGPLRAVGDIGSHWLDLTSYLLGSPVTSVLAATQIFLPERERPTTAAKAFTAGDGPRDTVRVQTEDAATVLIRFANGAHGSVNISQVSPGRKNALRLEIAGAESSLAWHGERPDELWIGHRERPNEILLRDPELLSPAAAVMTRLPGGHAEGFENSFAALYRAVYDHIADGGPTASAAQYPTFVDGHAEMLVLAAIARSADTQTWTDVDYDEEARSDEGVHQP